MQVWQDHDRSSLQFAKTLARGQKVGWDIVKKKIR